ncbi:DUF2752 domain-containing protein [Aestuariibaculum suncheonense]|uniref:DUF2752 domain-containing protein n=1 Tax=Aestuariibaculum suncheonense TaxID=1028745 RepID=A0A8J6UAV4_9FLAO|nr:DUF2752 domain-containing protein [Aestuariibaculum suncheonense]MBD0835723.1 DUF2752 domain-containing protein [Aestuariibaculum suncheonense]
MQGLEEYMLPCLNKKLFGMECMGCGMQRSLSLLVHGEFIAAFKMYPAIYTLLIMFLVIAFNLFKSFKSANRIILVLAIINAIIIITSFFIKTFSI